MGDQTVLESLVAKSSLHWSDYLVLILYFVAVIGVGIWVSLSSWKDSALLLIVIMLYYPFQ